ncbi:MAG: hypothetical protein H0U04_14130, partial [Rubrobacter sp.]|nr:hypothetical protein [Rubrobacter sp.]
VFTGLFLVAGFGAIASVVARFRRSRGVERQQMKLFAYVTVVLLGGAVLTGAISEATGVRWLEGISFVLSIAGLVSLPIAVGIAILRYRLYDIDVVINRTLVYGALTALLVLAYLGSVISLQYAFRAFTSGNSQLSVVASTLLIAALFNPLRRLVQDFIDRLFYRSKYDAKETLEAFNVRLRDETDLETLSGDLISVVRDTVRPTHAFLWLRSSGATGTREDSRQ